MASWLVHSTPDRAVWVRALAGDVVLCSCMVKTLYCHSDSLHPRYKWVPANCWRNLTNCGGVTCDGLASCPGEIEILLAASCHRNRDKLRQLWASLGSKASISRFSHFKTAVFRFCCPAKFEVFRQLSLWFSDFVNNDGGFSDFSIQCVLRFLVLPRKLHPAARRAKIVIPRDHWLM